MLYRWNQNTIGFMESFTGSTTFGSIPVKNSTSNEYGLQNGVSFNSQNGIYSASGGTIQTIQGGSASNFNSNFLNQFILGFSLRNNKRIYNQKKKIRLTGSAQYSNVNIEYSPSTNIKVSANNTIGKVESYEIVQGGAGTFLQYVYSSNENQYPNGGTQGEYWYKK